MTPATRYCHHCEAEVPARKTYPVGRKWFLCDAHFESWLRRVTRLDGTDNKIPDEDE